MRNIDLIVLGGGLVGCMAAKAAARSGLRTAIVERRGFLGRELTATGTTYLRNGTSGDELPVLVGALKKRLLQEQTDLGNVPLFFSQAAALALDAEGAACGVLLGNSYGTQYLSAPRILDSEGLTARLLGAAEGPIAGEALYHMEISNIGYYYQQAYAVAAELGISGDVIQLHPLLRDRAVTVSFSFRPDTNNSHMLAKRKAYDLIRWLRTNCEAFADAELTAFAEEAWLPAPAALPAETPRGLLCLQGKVNLPCNTNDLTALEDAVQTEMQSWLDSEQAAPEQPSRFVSGATSIPASECTFTPFDDRNMELPLTSVSFDPALIQARTTTDALLCGAGTSGAMAMRALAEQNVDFVLIEANSEIGGTNTVGGVSGYWNGHKGGINPSVDNAVAAIAEEISGTSNARHKAATLLYLHGLLRGHEAACHFGTLLCGSIRQGNRITGAYAATENGLLAFDASLTIDTTGDATVAALAGLPYDFGDLRDGSVQSYSQWGREIWHVREFREVRTTTDLDVIYQDKYSELLRGTYLAHRQNSNWDFSPMPTMRESRRIRGEYRLTLADILAEKDAGDTVCVSNTPFDAHGLGSNPLATMQVIICREPLRARIPYRCYLPAGIDGLLVGGKAFSGTRDAVCVCRMNADLRNAGYMLGLAAAMAISADVTPARIDLPVLQSKLRALDILPEWAQTAPPPMDYTLPDDRVNMARILARGTLPDDAKEALAGAPSQKQNLVRAWYGDEQALHALAQALMETAQADGMQSKSEEVFLCQGLTILAKDGSEAWVDAVAAAVAGAHAAGAPCSAENMYYQSRIDHWRVPNYNTLLALAYACQQLADARLGAPLLHLLEDEHLSGYVSPQRHGIPRYYFCSYLELALAQAAARCGVREGYLRLTDYLADARYQLSQAAHMELQTLTGQAFGPIPQDWQAWIAAQTGFSIVPRSAQAVYADDFPAYAAHDRRKA